MQAERAIQTNPMVKRGKTRAMPIKLYMGMCYAYMFLGLCSIIAGGLLYAMPLFLGLKHAKHIDFGMGFLIAVLIGFGLARIGAAIRNLRRLNTGRKL